uniref:Uncharacterized protein n=1 Tax=Glossina pallidipes TaxID=7398 RepID=A0A1A9ZD98_GLOPL
MPISKKSNKNADNKADSRQNRLTTSTEEDLPSGYVPQAQMQGNVSPTSAGATGGSVELAIPTIDLSETPPCALRFGHQNGNDEIFPIIDLSQTPQDDDVILVSETNEALDIRSPIRSRRRSNSMSTVSGQASNNNERRAIRRRRRGSIGDQSSIRNAPSSLHDSRSPLSVTAKKFDSPVRFACPICLESTVQREPTSTRCAPTSAGATGASVELAIPTIDLSETPPCALRFGRQNGNDEIFPIIDLTTSQDDDVILVSETNEAVDIRSPIRSRRRSNLMSTVSGQASNNNERRATRRRRRGTIGDQSSIRNAPSSLHHCRSALSATAKKFDSHVRFARPICLESTV